MKNLLILALAVLVLIALFGDGGLEVSPRLDFKPNLEFKPNVSYGTETTYTTRVDTYVESQTNIENQIVVMAPPASSGGGGDGGQGVTLLDPAGGATNLDCFGLYPGERVYNGPDLQGACFVQNEQGQKFFVNRSGVRWLLNGSLEDANGAGAAVVVAPAPTPLAPADGGPTLEQLQAAFLRNGGQLPWFWDMRSEGAQIDWLKEQAETWK